MTTIVNKKKIKVVLEKAKRKTWWYGVMITNISKLESSGYDLRIIYVKAFWEYNKNYR